MNLIDLTLVTFIAVLSVLFFQAARLAHFFDILHNNASSATTDKNEEISIIQSAGSILVNYPYKTGLMEVVKYYLDLITGKTLRTCKHVAKVLEDESIRSAAYDELCGDEESRSGTWFILHKFVLPEIVDKLIVAANSPSDFIRRRDLVISGLQTADPVYPLSIQINFRIQLFCRRNNLELAVVKNIATRQLTLFDTEYAETHLKKIGVI